MKKVSYFMMAALVAASSMFVSCGEDDTTDPINPPLPLLAPTINFKFGDKVFNTTGAKESVNVGDEVVIEFNYTAVGEIKEIELTIGTAPKETITTSFTSAISHKITKTLKAEFNAQKDIVITTKITDKQSPAKEATFTFTISVEENELEEDDFEWERVGGAAATGLAKFGLEWWQNTAGSPSGGHPAWSVLIRPLAGNEMYKFDSKVYDEVTTKEGLVKLFADNAGKKIDVFSDISSSVSKTYDIVLGTKVRGSIDYEYYLLRITHSTVSTGASTTIVVTGKYGN